MSKDKEKKEIVLGVDVGTTCCKCTAFTTNFTVLAESSREYSLIHGDNGHVEQDPEVWWTAVVETIREVLTGVKDYGTVRGVGISSQGITIVPVDEKGMYLINALTWLDMRATEQCNKLEEILSSEYIYKTTGKRISPAYSLPKMMWIKLNLPEIYSNTYKFLTAHDYVINRLCGSFCTEDSLAAGTMAYDIVNKIWDEGILDSVGVSVNKMPVILKSGSVAGKLSIESAELLGLDGDISVTTGGQDQKCAALGAGLSSDCITVSLGTSSAITALYEKPMFPKDQSLPCFPYIDGKSWVLEGFNSTSGASVKWLRDNLAAGRTFSGIDEEIEELYTNNRLSLELMFFPYLGGTGSPEWYDTGSGGFLGITLNTNLGQLAGAVLESIAFNIKSNLVKMESLGKRFNEISVFGGGAKSNIWLQMIADITGRRVRVPDIKESACLGAAIKCVDALGCSVNEEDRTDRIIYSDAEKNQFYNLKYSKYKKLENKIYGGD